MRAIAALGAAVAFALFFVLGFALRRAPDPEWLLAWEVTLQNHGTLIAWWLTWGCYVQVLAPLALICLAVAWRVPAWRSRAIFAVVMLLVCWRGADLFQHLFMRPRRLDWVVRHETAFSYPSSHAAIVTGFYLLWAAMLAASDLPPRVRASVPPLLIALSLGILWSRLALGAHYLTDLAGGVLLALALVAAAWAIVPVKVFTQRPRV
ncbi:MAG TPA: phosphatase PAP2 family protein [Candidatus Tumulicola sp.]|nr:phosphatase PAP2 family protein [Candidatus Tumulicola sp.]